MKKSNSLLNSLPLQGKEAAKGFTLVELIVVITILAILGTIAFISLQGYSASSRDSVRITDVSSMKTSLELFHLDAGKYPLPDEYGTFTYLGNNLYYQGYFGGNVIQNVSRNMNEIPKDPLTDREYIYSVANNKNEIEILSLLESNNMALNNINRTNAAGVTVIPKISGNYNGLFIKTPTHIVPLPSIINTEIIDNTVTEMTQSIINSMVIDSGKNIPSNGNVVSNTGSLTGLVLTGVLMPAIDVDDTTKAAVMEVIKSAYANETALNSNGIYNYILNLSTDNITLAGVFDIVVLGSTKTVTNSVLSTDGTCGTASKGYLYSETNYGTDTYCLEGTVTGGGTPTFPIEGGNTKWTCDGLNGGSVSSQCEATRTITPFLTICGNGDTISYQDAQDNKVIIKSNINNYIGCEINDYTGNSIPGSGVYIAGLTYDAADIMVIAKSDSRSLPWKSTATYTAGTTRSSGLENSNAFVDAGISDHLAGKICRNIGTNWYLPARLETDIIFDNKSSLGTFPGDKYWTSSQSLNTSARYVFSNNGSYGSSYKNITLYVRCTSRF